MKKSKDDKSIPNEDHPVEEEVEVLWSTVGQCKLLKLNISGRACK